MGTPKPVVATDAQGPRAELRRSLGDLFDFPADLVLDLPAPITLWLEVPGSPATIRVSGAATDSLAAEAIALGSEISFDRDETRAVFRFRNVGRYTQRLAAQGAHVFCNRLKVLRRPRREHDVGALARAGHGNVPPHPRADAGDDGDAIFEQHR